MMSLWYKMHQIRVYWQADHSLLTRSNFITINSFRSPCGEWPAIQPSSFRACPWPWWRFWGETWGSAGCRTAGGAACLIEKTFTQLFLLRCTVLTPGWGKRRALHFDLKSCQPTTWEVDRQTTFHLQILILNLSKLPKAADWMLTAMSAQSGGSPAPQIISIEMFLQVPGSTTWGPCHVPPRPAVHGE